MWLDFVIFIDGDFILSNYFDGTFINSKPE